MKGYRNQLYIKPGAPEIAARRKKREDDRRFWKALRDVRSQQQGMATN